MNARNKTQIFADRREPRGGDRNEQMDLLNEAANDIDADADCIMTYEGILDALRTVETKIAQKLNLKGYDIRTQLLQLDADCQLIEDDLVADWHDLYASYKDWKLNG